MERLGDNSKQLRFLLTAGRIRDALELLNLLSTYRFTALYRFDADDLQNLVLVDRNGASPPFLDAAPVGESYCAFVQATREAFVIEDSTADARVAGHPKQPVVRAYCGVPLKNARGEVFGTLCHFDYDAADVSGDAMVLMEEVATYLDPQLAADALAEGFDRRIDGLRGMLELIFAASADGASAEDDFEAYAAPIRDDALARLPFDRYSIIESKLLQLRQRLASMART